MEARPTQKTSSSLRRCAAKLRAIEIYEYVFDVNSCVRREGINHRRRRQKASTTACENAHLCGPINGEFLHFPSACVCEYIIFRVCRINRPYTILKFFSPYSRKKKLKFYLFVSRIINTHSRLAGEFSLRCSEIRVKKELKI